MNSDATSLDRLHDIVVPPPVPWWPPAPAWYAVVGVAVFLLAAVVGRWATRRRANAYRRAALRELATATSASAISEVLRRAALCIAPRPVVAALSGARWPNWLAEQCPGDIPEGARTQLAAGVYAPAAADTELNELREYAAYWIANHHLPQKPVR